LLSQGPFIHIQRIDIYRNLYIYTYKRYSYTTFLRNYNHGPTATCW
jgi:hypothetical protein